LALFIFGLLIFIHELGHFIVARLCGVKILEFAIGMGPKLISWKSKKTQTSYSLRLLPIGGFVSMLGENGMEAVQGEQPDVASDTRESEPCEASDDQEDFFLNSLADEQKEQTQQPTALSEEDAKHAYCNQSVWKRMLISLA
jgi:membrane-associated protease RseP (regulator of RpoE activity)